MSEAAGHLRLAHSTDRAPVRQVCVLAVWSGLVTGLVEGSSLLLLQRLGWMNWRLSWQFSVSQEIIWISAFFDLLLFLAMGFGVLLACQVFTRLSPLRAAAFLFSFLCFFDWIALTGRIRHLAVFILATGLAVAFWRWFRGHETQFLRFLRRTLPWVAALAVLAFAGIQGAQWLQERIATARLPAAASGTPNILIIVVDTLRADHLSSYGYARLTSPNIDAIAQQGVLFETAFATSSWTPPSHASMLTGRYPYEHRADGTRKRPLDGRYPTIAEALRDRGYRTAAFSGNNYVFGSSGGFSRGFIRFEDYFCSIADMAVRTLYGRKFQQLVLSRRAIADIPGRRWAEDINGSVLRWARRESHRPFFVFVNYMDVHDPYLPPQPHRSKFAKKKDVGGLLNTLLDRYYPELTPEQLQSEVDAYDGAISYVDAQIGQLLAQLKANGFGENTLVIITSDHGESFGEHGLLHHRNSLYREEIHVPLVIWWTGHLPAGRRVAQPVSTAALPATIMELLGATDQKLFPAPSLATLWQGQRLRPDWPHPLSELAQFEFGPPKKNPSYHGAMKSLVSPQWHFIVHEKFGAELYDWQTDPQEVNNVADTPEGQRIANEFALRLQEMLAPTITTRRRR